MSSADKNFRNDGGFCIKIRVIDVKEHSKTTTKLVLSALFLALGIVLPMLTGQIAQIGSMLLPMHIPVLLCGFICGYKYGAAVGFILPLIRTMLFGVPNLYPEAIAISFELASYGFLSGFLFSKAKWQCIKMLYRCLITAMLGGRIIRGIVQALLLGFMNNQFAIGAFLSGVIIHSIPGIILQLILVPSIMLALHRTHLVPFKNRKHHCKHQQAEI